MKPMSDVFERAMTITHSEFLRLLPKAVGAYPYSQSGTEISIKVNDGEINISLSAEYDCSIASLSLTATNVTFRIIDVAETTKSDFFKHFDRTYQRGGG